MGLVRLLLALNYPMQLFSQKISAKLTVVLTLICITIEPYKNNYLESVKNVKITSISLHIITYLYSKRQFEKKRIVQHLIIFSTKKELSKVTTNCNLSFPCVKGVCFCCVFFSIHNT